MRNLGKNYWLISKENIGGISRGTRERIFHFRGEISGGFPERAPDGCDELAYVKIHENKNSKNTAPEGAR